MTKKIPWQKKVATKKLFQKIGDIGWSLFGGLLIISAVVLGMLGAILMVLVSILMRTSILWLGIPIAVYCVFVIMRQFGVI